MIYFDSAASYPMLQEAKEALINASVELYGNPSSSHWPGETALEEVEKARELIADSIGAFPSEIVFTSGATEANNLALKGHFSLDAFKEKRHLIVSAIEHKCILAIADFLAIDSAIEVSLVSPNEFGIITPEAIKALLKDNTSLVSVMHVNNELGTINPIADIGELCFERGIKFHTDAAQSFLKEQIDVDEMNIDYLSISAHKVGGPKGIGALYIRDRRTLPLTPVIHGAGQEEGLRGGTLPAPIIVSMGKAVETFTNAYKLLKNQDLKSSLIDSLRHAEIDFQINGEGIPSLLSLTFPNTDVAALIRKNEKRFALSTGSACSSKEIEISHVLEAIGMNRDLGERTLRISFHHRLNNCDIEELVEQIKSYSLKDMNKR